MTNPQEKIQKLQMTEQSLQQLLMQKQQFQMQLMEIESALEELKTAKDAYKIIGNIMVASKKEDLITDLTDRKEKMALRIKTLDDQESRTREKATELQSEIMEGMKNVNKDSEPKDK